MINYGCHKNICYPAQFIPGVFQGFYPPKGSFSVQVILLALLRTGGVFQERSSAFDPTKKGLRLPVTLCTQEFQLRQPIGARPILLYDVGEATKPFSFRTYAAG